MTQTRAAAINAIAAHLNLARDAALAAARAANPGIDYPVTGPVLPRCSVNETVDRWGEPGKIQRDLDLYWIDATRAEEYIPDGVEADHVAQIQWIVICPSEFADQKNEIFEKGIAEIAAVLEPLCSRLTDPATDEPVALTFGIPSADPHYHDVGDQQAAAIYITLTFRLDAKSILS